MTNILRSPLRLEIWLPGLFALQEMKRGAEFTVKKLEAQKKSLEDQGLPTHEIDGLIDLWKGRNDEGGIIHQLSDQLTLDGPRPLTPAADPDDGQGDLLAQGISYVDRAEDDGEALSPDALRDMLAELGIHIPAAIIASWPVSLRQAAEARAQGDESQVFPGSWQLPEGFKRDAEGNVWDEREEPILLSVDELEHLAAEEVAEQEAVALRDGHPDQPWVVVDMVSGEGLARYHVMHRETRRRVVVNEQFVADSNADRENNGEPALDNAAAAEAFALYLSKVQPAGTESAGAPSEEDDAAEFARDLRDRLYRVDALIPLQAILGWTEEQRTEAERWADAELEANQQEETVLPPQHVQDAHVIDLPEGQYYHPDADYDAEIASRIAAELEGERDLAGLEEETFNFRIVGVRKPVRVQDIDTNRLYHGDWTMAEAQVVLAAWSKGQPATVRGEDLPVRDESVLMGEVGQLATA